MPVNVNSVTEEELFPLLHQSYFGPHMQQGLGRKVRSGLGAHRSPRLSGYLMAVRRGPAGGHGRHASIGRLYSGHGPGDSTQPPWRQSSHTSSPASGSATRFPLAQLRRAQGTRDPGFANWRPGIFLRHSVHVARDLKQADDFGSHILPYRRGGREREAKTVTPTGFHFETEYWKWTNYTPIFSKGVKFTALV